MFWPTSLLINQLQIRLVGVNQTFLCFIVDHIHVHATNSSLVGPFLTCFFAILVLDKNFIDKQILQCYLLENSILWVIIFWNFHQNKMVGELVKTKKKISYHKSKECIFITYLKCAFIFWKKDCFSSLNLKTLKLWIVFCSFYNENLQRFLFFKGQ